MNLQSVADELADVLGCPVAIEDPQHCPLALSSTAPCAEEQQWTRPSRINVRPIGGERVFLIDDDHGPLGALRLGAEQLPPLTASQYSLIDVAIDAARRILGPTARARSSRSDVLARLLGPADEVRRQSFAEAVERRWLRRGPHTIVRAVQFHDATSSLQRVALARRIDAVATSGLMFLAERDGLLFFASIEAPGAANGEEADSVIRAEARGRSMTVQSIGSARHHRTDEDLKTTADRAALAANIVGTLPDSHGRGDIADLGAWVLMASVAAESSQLAMLSPAAATLLDESDTVQQRTVEAFLDVRGSVREACEILHIHRTTLYYRLDNLPETVKDALNDGLKRSTLHLCLKLMRFRGGLEGRRAS